MLSKLINNIKQVIIQHHRFQKPLRRTIRRKKLVDGVTLFPLLIIISYRLPHEMLAFMNLCLLFFCTLQTSCGEINEGYFHVPEKEEIDHFQQTSDKVHFNSVPGRIQCALRCLKVKEFQCSSFSYKISSKTCTTYNNVRPSIKDIYYKKRPGKKFSKIFHL